MTHNKKVIVFPLRTLWSFWDFSFSKESNPIEDWYLSKLSEEAKFRFDALLKVNRKTDSHLNWVGFKRFLKGKLKREKIWELEFYADKRQYRILGKFGEKRKQIILLIGCYHKGSVYDPSDALDQAYKRARMLAEGEAVLCEREIKDDL